MPSPPAGTPALLDRNGFQKAVFHRDGHRCVFCDAPAVDAHHIIDRKLYNNCGYYLENGASVCERHHWDCETTRIPVEEVWRACGIENPVLPPGFRAGASYDKWGNRLRADGTRAPGPLFHDPGARKALAKGGVIAMVFPMDGDD